MLLLLLMSAASLHSLDLGWRRWRGKMMNSLISSASRNKMCELTCGFSHHTPANRTTGNKLRLHNMTCITSRRRRRCCCCCCLCHFLSVSSNCPPLILVSDSPGSARDGVSLGLTPAYFTFISYRVVVVVVLHLLRRAAAEQPPTWLLLLQKSTAAITILDFFK